MKVLIDTNILTLESLIDDLRARGADIYIGRATKDREVKGTRFESLVQQIDVAPETCIFGESTFPITLGGDEALRKILLIISSGSFPVKRDNLTDKQRNQLRDALIFESSIKQKCDIFCSNDAKAFIKHGKREKLEKEFGIKVRRSDEVLSEFDA